MTTDPAIKAIPGKETLRRLFRRVLEGISPIPRIDRLAKDDTQRKHRKRQKKALEIVARYEEEFKKRTRELGEALADDKMSLREFRARMLREIRDNLYTSAAAAAGGIGSLYAEDIQRIDRETKEQAQYLDNWVAKMERQPKEARSAKQIAHQASMYAGSGAKIANETIDKAMHRGFPDLPFYPKDRTICHNGCKCGWEWTRVDYEKGNADVYWRRRPAEHCHTCNRRYAVCSPLKIRDFQIINLPIPLGDLIDIH